jgi:uncharacterized DUF497 family protein
MDMPTDFEWDEAKAANNLAKHKLSFWSARFVFADPKMVVVDAARTADGESRCKAIGAYQGKLYAVVFVLRDGVCRLISARRTNAKEDRIYGNRSR